MMVLCFVITFVALAIGAGVTIGNSWTSIESTVKTWLETRKEKKVQEKEMKRMDLVALVSEIVAATLVKLGPIDVDDSEQVSISAPLDNPTTINPRPVLSCESEPHMMPLDSTTIDKAMPIGAARHLANDSRLSMESEISEWDRLLGIDETPGEFDADTTGATFVSAEPISESSSTVKAYVAFDHTDLASPAIVAVYRSDLTEPISTKSFGQGKIYTANNLGSLISWTSRSGKTTEYAVILGADSEGRSIVAPISVESGKRSGRITRKIITASVKVLDTPIVTCYWDNDSVPFKAEQTRKTTTPIKSHNATTMERADTVVASDPEGTSLHSTASLPRMTGRVEKPSQGKASKAGTTPDATPVRAATVRATVLHGQPKINPVAEIIVFASKAGMLAKADGLIRWVYPTSDAGKLAAKGMHALNEKGYTSRTTTYNALTGHTN